MKILSRDFTKKEKALIVILCILIIALCYYKFVYVNTNDAIKSAQSEQYNLQDEQVIATAKLAKLQKMQDEIDELKKDGSISIMPSYNASREEVSFLDDVLKGTTDYDIVFTTVTRSGNQIRRNLTISFKTDTYDKAVSVVEKLYGSDIRLLIGDINWKVDSSKTKGSQVSVSLAATFFETMVGGVEDAGLPAESK